MLALGRLCLYAIVPSSDADALSAAMRGLRLVACGPITAILGRVSSEPEPHAALRHDRIVGRALEACSSVVPFRLGAELGSENDLQRMLEANLESLSGYLARFQNRVEMGFKARLGTQAAGKPLLLPPGLEQLRALAPNSDDRWEQLERVPGGQTFEGCYLILRHAIDAFWSAVENIRHTAGNVPVLGSGPWAAYTFCDFTLRPAPIVHVGRHPDADSMR